MNTPLEELYVDDLPPDTRVLGGRVVVDVRIGRGGAATVYAATTADGKDVALKVMTAAYAKLPSSRQRFRNEFAAAQHLADHPFVVTPYEIGELAELGGRPYILMPLVKGRPMGLLEGRLPVVDAVTLMRDLARVVADVHARGIIHRDIKPGNVIVRDDGSGKLPYLLDFGLAYSYGAANAPVTVGLTAAHELPGTKHYMAPEQVLSAPPDPRVDVYALAITAWEVLTGVHPLEALTPADAARRKCDASLPSLSIAGKVPGLPRALERVIDAALERDPERRTASAERFAEQLTGVLAELRQRETPLAVVRSGGEPIIEQARAPMAGVEVEPPRIDGPAREAAATRAGAEARWGAWAVVVAVVVVALLGTAWAWRGPERARAQDTPEGAGVEAVGLAGASTDEGDGLEGSDVADVAAEPRAQVGPVLEAKAEPTPREGKTEAAPGKVERRPKPPRKALSPEAGEAPCPTAMGEAQAARRQRQWDRVLQLTKARCWDDDVQRLRLRVQALMELGRHRECAALGARSRDPEIVRLVKTCASQLEEKKTP